METRRRAMTLSEAWARLHGLATSTAEAPREAAGHRSPPNQPDRHDRRLATTTSPR